MMDELLLRTVIAVEHDVFVVRQQGREVAARLGMEAPDQSRVATALSEVGRVLFTALGEVQVEFRLAADQAAGADPSRAGTKAGAILEMRVWAPWDPSRDVAVLADIDPARRLMDRWAIDRGDRELAVVMARRLPTLANRFAPAETARVREELSRLAPSTPLQELAVQNRQLLAALAETQAHRDELLRLNAELEETNRGVMALYNQLSDELEATNRGVVALYAELDDRSAQLRQASEAKSRFFANASHELRAPATAIIGLLRLLLDPRSDPLTEDQRQQLELIRGSTQDLVSLVNTLLDLAKAESGRLEPALKHVDLAALFATLRGTMRALATNPDVSVVVEEPRDAPPIISDEVMLTQILRNLLTNAIKFTPSGEVRLGAVYRPEAATVDLIVTDTGIGIALDEQERIFEEFYQASSNVHVQVKGTGLGLPLARRLATLLGGSLTMHSTPGVGSTFTVRLPMSRPTVMPPLQRYRVLVVDDDAAFRAAVSGVMRAAGAAVVEAADGRAALAAIRSQTPDIVLLDLRMPEADGRSVLDALATDERLAGVPVVVLTAFTRDVDGAAGLPRAAAVLGKADTALEALPSVVHSVLDQWSGR